MKNIILSPQVFAATISSIVALALGVLPILTNTSETPVPTLMPTLFNEPILESPTVILSTESIPTETPVIAPTEPIPTEIPIIVSTPTSTPILVPTMTSVPPTVPPSANILLIYDDVSFTVYNQSSQTLPIHNIRFRSANGSWDAIQWGATLASSLPADNCLRMRDTASDQRQPPPICGNLLGLQLVGSSVLFWLNTDEFEILRNGIVIATCSTVNDTCPIFIP